MAERETRKLPTPKSDKPKPTGIVIRGLRGDPMVMLAMGRLPGYAALRSRPTLSRPENLPVQSSGGQGFEWG